MKSLLSLADQWQDLSRLLDEALALAPHEQAAWLDRLAEADAVHHAALAELLARQAAIGADEFLSRLPALAPPASADDPVVGAAIGPYCLIRPLGAGGMGLVWEAERTDGFVRRRVALKLPRTAWGGRFAERLARERDILAALEHEHIARLYDAGVDRQGRPYLAMELIDGEPVTAWCRNRQLGVRQCVALLLQAAAAVSHAHARLIVHRDLKPSNILVGSDGRVRLLDFGVAKLLENGRTQATVLTELSGRVLSLDYASPEQIAGLSLGTGSDVYSLAVVAYEMLTGHKPYRLKRGTATELEEAIAAADVVSASSATVDPARRRQLRGDLDAVLNRAMKKRPEERYPTMDAFSQDLRRFLDGAPVEARPDSWRYRAGKFVRRHRLQVGAGGAVVIALVAGMSVALWQAREARRSAQAATTEAAKARVEAATARAVQAFLESVFKANSKFQADPGKAATTTARELLDRGAERIATELAAEPEAQLRLYYTLGEMYDGMWQFDRALVLFRRALELGTQLHGAGSDVALRAAASSGYTLDDLGRREEALAVLLEADAVAGRRAADRDAVRARIDAGLARLYMRVDLSKALARARNAAALSRAQGASPEGIDALQTLGETAILADRLEEAREALTQAVAWTDRMGAQGMQSIVLAELGMVQDRLGQPETAEATVKRAAAMGQRLGDDAALHNARYELGRIQVHRHLWREFLATTGPEIAWARANRAYAEMRQLPAAVLANYGRALVGFGDAARGLAVLDEARAMLPPETTPARRAQLLAARAAALLALDRPADAGADIERALAMVGAVDEHAGEELRATRRRHWVAIGKASQALEDFRAHAATADGSNPALSSLARSVEEASLLLAAGDWAAAETVAGRALESIHRLQARRMAGDAEARLCAVRGEAMLRQGRAAEALQVLRHALALSVAAYDPARSPDVERLRRLLRQAGHAGSA